MLIWLLAALWVAFWLVDRVIFCWLIACRIREQFAFVLYVDLGACCFVDCFLVGWLVG
jgi:hypothetical protein